MTAIGKVLLLDADPDLVHGMDETTALAATTRSLASTVSLQPGRWSAIAVDEPSLLYVISGAIVRTVEVDGRATAEILGPGDVFTPSPPELPDEVVGEVGWRVLSPAWLAVLDAPFWVRMGPFPSATMALFERTQIRVRSLAVRMAMNGEPNLGDRILQLFRHLAHTHGRVTSSGTLIELDLSHETISRLVSAQRPSVSTSLKRLQQRGELVAAPNGGFLLPPASREFAIA